MAGEKKYLIVVSGPTAVGKTSLTIDLARHFCSEILSADSRQFYREMNIGTAKPSVEERSWVKHYFIDDLSIHDAYSVGDFERDALRLLEELYQTRSMVFLTGGSGLFIRALCEGLDHFPKVPKAVRQKVLELYEERGTEGLQKALQENDPHYYSIVDRQNPHRLIRALSVCWASGQPYSSFLHQARADRPFRPIYIRLDIEREKLYERINRRVDEMVDRGLVAEASELFPFRHLISLQTVGYQELFAHFEGNLSLDEAIELIKRNTRRYAKRQGTWFRKNEYWKVFRPDEKERIIAYIREQVASG